MIKYACECVACNDTFFNKNEYEILCNKCFIIDELNKTKDNMIDLQIREDLNIDQKVTL